MLDIYAPIIPYVGMANIKLYNTIEELQPILSLYGATANYICKDFVRYDIGKELLLFFHRKNNKLFKITTEENYKGTLFDTIKVGMHETELESIDSSFVYDDFEEVWISSKGVFIEAEIKHAYSPAIIRWISVFIPELETEDFWKGEW